MPQQADNGRQGSEAGEGQHLRYKLLYDSVQDSVAID